MEEPVKTAPSAERVMVDADELAALRKDRASLNGMATLLAEARRALEGRPVQPHRSGGPVAPDTEPSFATSSARLKSAAQDLHDFLWMNIPDLIEIKASGEMAGEGLKKRMQALKEALK